MATTPLNPGEQRPEDPGHQGEPHRPPSVPPGPHGKPPGPIDPPEPPPRRVG
jgi:hypothetical protein